jgi:hypothetical protein
MTSKPVLLLSARLLCPEIDLITIQRKFVEFTKQDTKSQVTLSITSGYPAFHKQL